MELLADIYSYMLLAVLWLGLQCSRALAWIGLRHEAYALAGWCKKEAEWAKRNL